MATAAVGSRTHVNLAQQYHFPCNKISKIPGADFEILTLVSSKGWFERWIFPQDFIQSLKNPSHTSPLHIGRMVRCLYPFSIVDSPSITARDPIHSELDGDYLYKAKRVFEEKGFFEDFKAGKSGSTEFSYDNKLDKIFLQIQLGSGSIKFEIEKESSHHAPGNHLLDRMLPPPTPPKARERIRGTESVDDAAPWPEDYS